MADIVDTGGVLRPEQVRNEKTPVDETLASLTHQEEDNAKHDLELTGDDLLELEKRLSSMTLEKTRDILVQIQKLHYNDQNFPQNVLERIHDFLTNPDVFENPEKHADLIKEMKLEAIVVTENSPYAEVRAVVDNTDDDKMPSLTFRTWFIGIIFSGIGAAVNQLFSLRQPPIFITSEVAQLLAYPAGKTLESILPDWGFTVRGVRHSLNPGPFNKKEHMLITIMTNVAFNTIYTTYIIVTQVLPIYFNQPYARGFGYQILASLGTNMVGYGMAVTIALNQAFHSTEGDSPVAGPFGRIFRWTRMRFFNIMFAAMFVYFFFPGYIFTALSNFNWMTWIAPNNGALAAITGFSSGLGINPWPTFDFNVVIAWCQSNYNPLVMPAFTTINMAIGMSMSAIMAIGIYYTNKWNTGYLPISDNHIYDNKGKLFKVANVIDSRGIFDAEKYQKYSMPWMAAFNLTNYFWFFAQYTSAITYTILFHGYEVKLGFQSLFKSIRNMGKKQDKAETADLTEDIHMRLMRRYEEAPEWWYLVVLAIFAVLGMVGVGCWETYTSVGTVPYGIALALIFVIPVGLITAITGMQITLNVLAELIGGAISPGNALSMNYFKSYGYITTAQAIFFLNDLKLAHYVKIPPRHTFIAQMVATLLSTFVQTAMLNFQLNGIPNVCTHDAPFSMTCPGVNTFFTAAVFWGTIGPKRVFGEGPYKELLIGFPVGVALPLLVWLGRKKWPSSRVLRGLHPAVICFGALSGAPYNMAYMIPSVYMAIVSWFWVRGRYFAFWSKYNFVLAAAWTSGVAIAALVIFFALTIPKVELEWWGNTVSSAGCDGEGCARLPVPEVGYFGPEPGTYP